ncbi:MAG TPA: 3-methyl-2-oxobutanoate hydroxymethyltransferase [bacterium]
MDEKRKKIKVPDLERKKSQGEKIVMLTAYDYLFARIVDEAGVDIILVGDSLGTVIAGHTSTLPVTLRDIIYHASAVSRGVNYALVVADMPFLSYQVSIKDAKKNCGTVIKETGAAAVKVEGGRAIAKTIRALVDIGIPVMGHVGMTPQSLNKFGGYRVQGKTPDARKKILEDALAVEAAGAFSVVLEAIPSDLAAEITSRLRIPAIGIGAGVQCDGQVIVLHDMLGLFDDFKPVFVKRYANLKDLSLNAIKQYSEEVRNGKFPDEEHSYK